MMAVEGIDFAWYKPTPAQVRAVGASWVAGYFSTDTSKNLTKAEVSGFLAAGVGVVTVWETAAGRATAGFAAGQADARAADGQRAAVGLGADHPIYFAVDESTSWASVVGYFDGVTSVLGIARVGAYGDYAVITGAYGHSIHFLWQTVAWSAGQWSPHASIRQPGGTLMAGQADVDYAEATDFGQSPRPATPAPAPGPAPTPSTLAEDDMPFFTIPAGTKDTAGNPIESGRTFGRGKFTNVAFFCDNTLTGGAKDAGAKLRVVIWADGGPQVHDGVVVSNAGGKQTVVPFASAALTHSVTVTREDSGTYPVFVEVS